MRINNVYFPTWSEGLDWEKGEGQSKLALISNKINYVTLAFIRPDTDYQNMNSKMDELFYDGELSLNILKREIEHCRKGAENRIILASTGGEIGGNFLNVNYDNVVNGIADLGLDGLDIDYEPNGLMTESSEEISKYIELIKGFRKAFDNKSKVTGKKYILSCAPTGIGLLGADNDFCKNGISDPDLLQFDSSSFNETFNHNLVVSRLKNIIPPEEQSEELNVGKIGDDNILKQPKLKVGTLASCFSFNSAGKMASVFLSKISSNESSIYEYVGQMVDIVFYQAYNMGSGNVLGKIVCYESHRALSDYFNQIKDGSGFLIGHGSHVGMEAWPHFSYTKKRLSYIYNYIAQYGRDGDGASFWSYTSSIQDESENVPEYGMGYQSVDELFDHVGTILEI